MISFAISLTLLLSSTIQDEQAAESKVDRLSIEWMQPGQVTQRNLHNLVSASPDGVHLATAGSEDATVKIWNINKRTIEKTIVFHPKQQVRSVDYATDGSMLLVAYANRAIIFETAAWKARQKFLLNSKNGMIFVDGNRSIMSCDSGMVFDANQGTLLSSTDRILISTRTFLATNLMNPDRTTIATSALGRPYPVDGDVFKDYIVYQDIVSHQPIESYQSRLMTSSRSMWGLSQVESDASAPLTFDYSFNVTTLPGGDLLYFYAGNRPSGGNALYRMTVNHSFTGYTELATMPLSRTNIMCNSRATKSAKADRILISVVDKIAPTRDLYWHFLFDGYSLDSIGKPIVTNSAINGIGIYKDRVFMLLDALTEFDQSDNRIYRLTSQNKFILGLHYKNNSSLAAVSMDDGTVRVWNPANPDEEWRFSAPVIFQPKVNRKLMSPALLTDIAVWDGKLIGATIGSAVFVLDAKTGKQVKKHIIDPDAGSADWPLVRYVREGEQMLVASNISAVGLRLLDTVSGKVLKSYKPSEPASVIEATEHYVCAVSADRMRIWDTESAKLLYEGDPPFPNIMRLAIDDGLKILVAGTSDGKAAAYELLSGKKKHDFKELQGALISMCMTKDGRLITLSDDEEDPYPMRVWDIASGRLLKKYTEDIGPCGSELPFSNRLAYDAKSGTLAFTRGDATIVGAKID